MIFGDPSRIAIELKLEDDYADVWLLGRVCYWICGRRVGDYEYVTTLRDVLL